uniref:Uncharacterized protein n=1 Tax=Candidatus Methanophaga sp. ANME-1 ERB7 TaxID=2759913 RepID=A0A7G9Z837_9EURY|nr:hypothetical protein EIIOIEJP_00028 [Methanosarcinales archaeon ANME-1 ERB7]
MSQVYKRIKEPYKEVKREYEKENWNSRFYRNV